MNRVQVTKANNVAITFNDASEQKRFTEALNKEPIKGAEIRTSREKPLHFAIRGVPAIYNSDDLMDEIRRMNPRHPYIKLVNDGVENLAISDVRRDQLNLGDTRKFKTFKLSTTMKYAKLLLDNEFLQLLFNRVQVTVWKPNERCANCLGKDHRSRDCRGKQACKHCGGEHLSYTCRSRNNTENHKCVVCQKAGKEYGHRADVGVCPILKSETIEYTECIVATILANHG